MKRIGIFIIVMIMIISITGVSAVYADSDLPDSIRVGLCYNSTAMNTVDITSDGGIEIFMHKNDIYDKLITITDTDTLKVIKDGYYTFSNGVYTMQDIPQGADAGPYHMQISSYDSVDDAMKEVQVLEAGGYDAYLAYNDGYEVWVGNYLDASNASSSGLNGNVIDGSRDVILVKQNGNTILAFVNREGNELYLKPLSGYIYEMGKPYRGDISFIRNNSSDMTVINILPIEEYLYGVLPNEMPSIWPEEALKAQAVAARTYAVYNIMYNDKFKSLGFDVGCSTDSQVYKGKSTESPVTNKAVDMTRGIVLEYNGKPIEAFFHSHSGGYTADISDVYSSSSPVFVGKEDPYSLGYAASYDEWRVTLSAEDLLNKIIPTKGDIGMINSLSLTRSYTGRVLEMDIDGMKGSAVMKKNEIRNAFGLKSTLFDMETDSDIYVMNSSGLIEKKMPRELFLTAESNGVNVYAGGNLYSMGYNVMKEIPFYPSLFIIKGSGYGHGVGLSQYGARGMADKGFGFVDILKYYYNDVDVYDTINDRHI
ncbi:MAG: SpoIID/LytB domain-containing protein [Thermoanaerobacteraceae bacterium]|nr:SpoIID/LytB domain-containing protein [Thermoanaerobacteraceae bacterium]